MIRPVILADADNTLWDTDAVFADAQLGMLAAIDESFADRPRDDALAYVRRFDQALAQADHRHLRYPPSMLARSLALATKGFTPETAAAAIVEGRVSGDLADDEVESLIEAYIAALHAVPKLLPGVVEGLTSAADAGIAVWILTEGPAERQRNSARLLGIDALVQGVGEIQKNASQFARQRHRFLPSDLYVIGDQPDRDIAPAQAAGCFGVLVPSQFRPNWVADIAWIQADYVAENFAAGIQWIISNAVTPESRPAPSA
ncbi:HAD family hydrolase [Altererythrobacter sp. Root672]|uniref:HAD family hydrolase n=1 Tax=Altererythrobacter sp. Root672 TaxID=1736584 RepID=UPI0006F810CF|nr:HAD family hydrolase [Altererythrobacter sp. Root672]KRA84090.1 hypothetical protein ASD76_08845 [Altererythrobacter sp. Root672]